MTKQSNKFFLFFHKRIFALIVIAAVIIIFVSTSYYEYASEPQAPEIPAGIFVPVNYQENGWFTVGFNGTTYPAYFNESGKSYAAMFELMLGPPYLVTSGILYIQAGGISIINKTAGSPYTNVSFYISAARLTIGNYSTNNYDTETANGHIFINFHEEGYDDIGSIDKPGTNYTGQFSITITPVLFFSFYHIQEKPFTMVYKPEHLWYRISSNYGK